MSTGRLCASASAISRSIRRVRSPQCAAAAQVLSTAMHDRSGAGQRIFAVGIEHRLGQRRITSAAASMRIKVSHQGVCAGVFSRFSTPIKMRVGGNARRRGRGGMVRSSHQMTGSASSPASSHGLRKAIAPKRHG